MKLCDWFKYNQSVFDNCQSWFMYLHSYCWFAPFVLTSLVFWKINKCQLFLCCSPTDWEMEKHDVHLEGLLLTETYLRESFAYPVAIHQLFYFDIDRSLYYLQNNDILRLLLNFQKLRWLNSNRDGFYWPWASSYKYIRYVFT